jgi:hypothetical protein
VPEDVQSRRKARICPFLSLSKSFIVLQKVSVAGPSSVISPDAVSHIWYFV